MASLQPTIEFTKFEDTAVFIDPSKVEEAQDKVTSSMNNIVSGMNNITETVNTLLRDQSTQGQWRTTLESCKTASTNKSRAMEVEAMNLNNKLAMAMIMYLNKIVQAQQSVVQANNNL